ncbi:putative phosphoserine phosphatase 2 [Deinococcus carri]|uniref:Phosphoserine phosphatase 2 n=1 Tax=Deinococcus carri TaxID=1211323 RepID=A0ABP9W493_9DEIO
MPARRLFLIRHARTASNVAQTLGAGHDDPLDPLGERQAQAVAAHLAALNLPAPRVYASPYRRARQTAQAIADALGVPVTVLVGVQEFHTGSWVGRPYSHLQTHHHEWLHEDGTLGFPGGESLQGVARRFQAALEGVLEEEGTPLVVSHGGALSSVLPFLLGTDLAEAWQTSRYQHGNTAVTELVWEPDGWVAVRVADGGHLEGML